MQIKIKINCYLKHIVRIVIFLLSHLLQTSLKCGYRTSFFSFFYFFFFFLVGSVTFIIKTKKKNYDRLLEYYKINIQISFKTLKLLILEF